MRDPVIFSGTEWLELFVPAGFAAGHRYAAIAPLGIYGRPRAAGEAVTNRIFRNLRCRPIAHRLLARRRRRPAYCVAEIDDDEHAGRGDAAKSLMRGRRCEPFFPFADPPYQCSSTSCEEGRLRLPLPYNLMDQQPRLLERPSREPCLRRIRPTRNKYIDNVQRRLAQPSRRQRVSQWVRMWNIRRELRAGVFN